MSAAAEKVVLIESATEKSPIKTMLNCNAVEFLRQSNKIRHAIGNLLEKSGISEIRKHMPELTGQETDAEKKRLLQKQAQKNMNDILDALLDTNAEMTASLLAMLCFRESENINGDKGMDYINVGLEVLLSKPVMDFLLKSTSLALLSTDG